MRADIHGGPEHSTLQSEAGYIDARPQADSSTKASCNARPHHTFGSAYDVPIHTEVVAHPPCSGPWSGRSMSMARRSPSSFTDCEAGCSVIDLEASGVDFASFVWWRRMHAQSRRSSLNAWPHSLRVKPGISQSIHNGSIARAASTLPMSAVSQPNWSRIAPTVALAAGLLPQMNIVGLPSANCGFTISELPTELNALTKCASGKALCSCSISD